MVRRLESSNEILDIKNLLSFDGGYIAMHNDLLCIVLPKQCLNYQG